MPNKDPFLEQLYSIQNDLKENDLRINTLEKGRVAGQDEIKAFLNETKNKSNIEFDSFLSNDDLQRINRDFNESLNNGVECDVLEHSLAAAVGVICGLVDIIFVKTPNESMLTEKSDKLFENIVLKIANKRKKTLCEKDGKEFKEILDIKGAIGYLEQQFSVPYDQAKAQEVNKKLTEVFENQELYRLSPNNHHAKSLGHYPDVFGLIASICNQFTNTSTFLDNQKGRITIVNGTKDDFELQGNNTSSKIFCGFVNWFFHCISDVSGSSGSQNRGQGLPLPFSELFQFCNFGKLKNEKGQYQTFATVMTRVYEEGYDLRHGASTAVPVVLNDILVRLVFVFKKYFVDNLSFVDIIGNNRLEPTMQRMSTVSIGSMCAIDLAEAAITSWGNWVQFFSHLNLSEWTRFGFQCVKELHIISDQEMNNIMILSEEVDKEWTRLLEETRKI